MGIENYSKTAANNNNPSPNGWPEGMPPSGVNDSARQNMADLRTWYEDSQWINLGYTHVYASSASFTIATTDYTSVYHAGRRIKAVGLSTGTIYGTITSSSYSSSTTVNVSWDSGSLQNETLTISVAALTKTNDSIPYINKQSADVASASTVDLNAVRGDLIDITGTTTITAITLAQGQERTVRFTGALTLTHGSSLVLPTAANITTAAGDYAIFRGYASSVVRCVGYFRADGKALAATGSFTDVSVSGKFSTTAGATQTIASGALTAPCSNFLIDTEGAAASDDLDTINGGVDGMTISVGCVSAARTVVIKNGTGNIINLGGDITIANVNQRVRLQFSSSLSKWLVDNNKVVKVVETLFSAAATGSTQIPLDDSIPQIGEGNEYMTQAITPTNTNNILYIDVVFFGTVGSSGQTLVVALFQDAITNALASNATIITSAAGVYTTTIQFKMGAGTVSSTTFRVRAGAQGGTVTFNGSSGNRLFGGVACSSIKITEIQA